MSESAFLKLTNNFNNGGMTKEDYSKALIVFFNEFDRNDFRVLCLESLTDLRLETDEVRDFLENIYVSDESEFVRFEALKSLYQLFPDFITKIYKTFEDKSELKSQLSGIKSSEKRSKRLEQRVRGPLSKINRGEMPNLEPVHDLFNECVESMSVNDDLYGLLKLRYGLDDLIYQTKCLKDSSVAFNLSIFTIYSLIESFSQTVLGNYNYHKLEVQDFSKKLSKLFSNFINSLDSLKYRILTTGELISYIYSQFNNDEVHLRSITDVAEIVEDRAKGEIYYQAKPDNAFCIDGKFHDKLYMLEHSLCDFKFNAFWFPKWLELYSDKIDYVIYDLGLDRDNVKLVFSNNTEGLIGPMLLQPSLVGMTKLNATHVYMHWKNKKTRVNIATHVPRTGDDFIMVYDLNYEFCDIPKVNETLSLNGAKLHAAIVLKDYSPVPLEGDVKLYTLF